MVNILGEIIGHDIYGVGKVLKKRYSGLELYVHFNDGIPRWVKSFDTEPYIGDDNSTNELEIEQILEKKIIPKEELKAGQILITQEINQQMLDARRIIEALRLGISPNDFIEKFTFGRKKETEYINNWLNNSNKGSLIISGEYGVGKSHFLEYIKLVAINNNWAVSLVEFDNNELPLHKPKAIYERIIKSFKYQNGNFRDFLKEIANNPRNSLLKTHVHLNDMIRRIIDRIDWEYCWRWIYGYLEHAGPQASLPPIYFYSTGANIISYILSGIGFAAKKILGLNGFLILFDEAENIEPYWYTKYQIRKGWNFLKGLILMANNNKDLLSEGFREIITKPRECRGVITNLQYYFSQRFRYLWKNPCWVKLLFAFTPNDELFKTQPLKKIEVTELNHLGFDTLQEIASEIAYIYKQAYNFKTDKKVPLNFLKKKSTRFFIKSIVEILDLIRFHPQKQVIELVK